MTLKEVGFIIAVILCMAFILVLHEARLSALTKRLREFEDEYEDFSEDEFEE